MINGTPSPRKMGLVDMMISMSRIEMIPPRVERR